MKVLVVGAGAVGLVYGRHLQLGGAKVSFLVKEKHAAEARAGYDVYLLNKGRKRPPVRFEGFEVLTEPSEAVGAGFDQLWLCVSSTALKAGWLDAVIEAVGPDCTVVGMQPGADDKDYVLARCAADRLVWGLITFISYQSPLPGEELGEGLAYWLPPLTPNPFGGPEARARSVVDALNRGGCRARLDPAMVERTGIGGAALIPWIAALEGAGWSLSELRSGPMLSLASGAALEAAQIVAAHEGGSVPLLLKMARPWMIKLLLPMAPLFVPLPLEIYLKYHFTKVGDQTRDMLNTYASMGRKQGQPFGQIEALQSRLLSAPGGGA